MAGQPGLGRVVKHETFYRPLWESFARAGYASLSFSKPGVAGSEGDWLEQSMADRARETLAAVAWARGRTDIDGRRIGLWGASVIAVAPAVNWLRQGRYDLLTQLRRDGAGPRETARALRRSETTLALLRRGASYDEYRATLGRDADMTRRRWRFATRNYTADAVADLRAMRGTPVLLVLAGHDVHVDAAETETVYRGVLPSSTLEVAHYPGAAHSLVDHDLESREPLLTATAILLPRRLYTDGFLADQARYVRRFDSGSGTR
ncbi:alpha/beta hydrolase family protein [Streptomyces sp. NPDC058294]|uniref:alpha/beta hydrolase family protein n=1 Tax=Streptomyces sp. NPDC058294 TaxID=3346430 RepID=UPI0036EBB8D6